MSGMKFDRNGDAPEYEDCFDTLQTQRRLAHHNPHPVTRHMFDRDMVLTPQVGVVGGRDTMVRHIPPQGHSRYAAGSAAQTSRRAWDAFDAAPLPEHEDRHLQRVGIVPATSAKSGKYASQHAHGPSVRTHQAFNSW